MNEPTTNNFLLSLLAGSVIANAFRVSLVSLIFCLGIPASFCGSVKTLELVRFLGAVSVFWLMRTTEQLIFWKIEKIGVAFFAVFLIGAGIFAAPIFF